MASSLAGFRITARTLARQPVFTTVVVLSLALAIAVNTTMYGVLDALTHPRLDIRDPAALYWVRLYGDNKHMVDNRARDAALSTGLHGVESVTWSAPSFGGAKIVEHDQTIVEAGVVGVGENYFDVLGPRLVAGRTFGPADAQAGSAGVVITDELAARLFPNGESAVGARIDIDRAPHTVIGVITSAANFPHEVNRVWKIAPFDNRGGYVRLIRLRPGVSPKDAERELATIAASIAAAAGEPVKGVAFRFHAASDPGFQVRTLHYALVFAVCAVLLVACANLANLQLARGISRRRDLALRSALGATRRRLVGHLLRESVLLAGGGLGSGLLLTDLGGRLFAATIPTSMGEYVVEPHMSWRVLAFAVVATVLCLLLVGLAPSLYASRTDPNDALKSGAGTGASSANRRKYGILVAVEIALALALTSAAVVTVRMALFANAVGVGFDVRPLMTGFIARTSPAGTVIHYSELLQDVAARVKSVDGVTEATAKISMKVVGHALSVEDPGGVREVLAPNYVVTVVSPSYFRTFRMPIVRGHDFRDGERDVGSVIIDEQTAKVLWPNADPVGAQIKLGELKAPLGYVRVAGVVGQQPGFESDRELRILMRNIHSLGRVYYLPGATDTMIAGHTASLVQATARTDGNTEATALAIRRALQGSADVRTFGMASMDQFMGITRTRQSTRFMSSLFSLFAALGVGLAAFGVYGVVAHSVAERRRELGVRIALGATARDILRAVLRESLVVVLLGVAVGLLCTKYGVMLLGELVFDDDTYNAGLFAGVALALALTTAAAALIPARRATLVDPTESLRNE
jgi:putative ABC transport system permease protein